MPSSAWITWAKSEIQRFDDDLPLYVCRLMRLLETFHRDGVNREPGVETKFLATAVASGMAVVGRSLSERQDWRWDWPLVAAEQRQLVLRESVDEWCPGMASGSGWKCYIRLTVAGRRCVESQDLAPPPSWTASPSDSRTDAEDAEEPCADTMNSQPTASSDTAPVEAELEEVASENPISAVMFFRNEARDHWIYQECFSGTPYKNIVTALRNRVQSDGWEPIETEQGILRAARSYAESKQWPEPPARKRGRPKQTEN